MIDDEVLISKTIVVLAVIDLIWAFGPYFSGRDRMLSIPIVIVTTAAIAFLFFKLRNHETSS